MLGDLLVVFISYLLMKVAKWCFFSCGCIKRLMVLCGSLKGDGLVGGLMDGLVGGLMDGLVCGLMDELVCGLMDG